MTIIERIKRLFFSKKLKVYMDLFDNNMRSIYTYQNILKYIKAQESAWNVGGQDITCIDMKIVRKLEYEVLLFKNGELIPHPRLETKNI